MILLKTRDSFQNRNQTAIFGVSCDITVIRKRTQDRQPTLRRARVNFFDSLEIDKPLKTVKQICESVSSNTHVGCDISATSTRAFVDKLC
jgi:hypothetical protein